jgi:hypothetical protein
VKKADVTIKQCLGKCCALALIKTLDEKAKEIIPLKEMKVVGDIYESFT